MSSHREAPEIAKDAVADSTDLYAFVSPDKPDTVTIIANYVPLEAPDGGPNFYEFGGDVLYSINIDNTGDGHPDISYQFRFTNKITNPDTFLYNTGPITTLTHSTWNRRQYFTLTRVANGSSKTLGSHLACPPCNIGPLSTPDYAALAAAAIHQLPGGGQVFAGQRAEGFFVDLGAIFDLAILRPFEQDHATFGLANTGLGSMAAGVNSTKGVNVHSIALQVPKSDLTKNGSASTSASSTSSVIGVWTTAARQKARVLQASEGTDVESGPWVQVSRLGNPLVNEVIVPMSKKDYWNAQPPSHDQQFAPAVAHPELAQLLPTLYPGVFPNLAAYNAKSPHRADLLAIFLTGIPTGVVSGFQNSMGTTQADMLRLNTAIPPTTTGMNNLGLIGMDAAGYPNGRRVFDDVVTIELRALAGATIPLVDKSFTPDAAATAITDGLTSGPTDTTASGDETYLPSFPYLGTPLSGFAAGTS
ncbi:MAG TPA: DUF4331 domain-containing protein [Acidimicrobiales bacterium]|jgi:hypothetical protein|nr:DUF4331 domain-containing protein [Acidimicrobiales bacterium]